MQNKTEEERRMRGPEGGPGGREQPGPALGGETGAAEEKLAGQDDGEVLEESGGPEEADGQAERIAGLERALLDSRCRLAAFAAGVSPELVGDAVTLAVQAAREEGEATEEAVAAALEQVLRRHPGWRADARRAGNFRLGADEPAAPRPAAPAQDAPKRWNRFR